MVGLGHVDETKRVFDFRRPTVDAAEIIAGVDVLQEHAVVRVEIGDAEDGSVGHKIFSFV